MVIYIVRKDLGIHNNFNQKNYYQNFKKSKDNLKLKSRMYRTLSYLNKT